MKRIFFWMLLIFACTPFVWGQVVPYDLSVEYLGNPVGIDVAQPRLSWKSMTTDGAVKDVVQTAYRVSVASTPEMLANGEANLWDSGKVESDQSLNIEYAGAPLTTSQRCYWKVQVWYASKDEPLCEATSPGSSWVMGVMNPDDWKAKWIASDPKFRNDYNLQDVNWIWAGNATDLTQAPAGRTCYRKEFVCPSQADTTIDSAILAIAADETYTVFLNGEEVVRTWGFFNKPNWMRFVDVKKYLRPGKNFIAVEVNTKKEGPTGLLLSVDFNFSVNGQGGYGCRTGTDADWSVTTEPPQDWNESFKQTGNWKSAVVIGPVDCEPWGKINRIDGRYCVNPAFQKDFSINKSIQEATLHVTGVGFYEAQLNGKKIGNKVLDPAQTRYDKRVLYSTFDLTDSLNEGENRFNVILGHGWYDVRSLAVWNFDNAPWRDFPRMILQLEVVYDDGSREWIVSDDTWEQTTSPIILDCIRQGEASTLSSFEVIGKACEVAGPAGKLVAQAIPPSVITQEWKPVQITEPKPGVYVVDTGQNMAGWIRLNITGQQESDIIGIRYAERLATDGNIDMKPFNEHFRQHYPLTDIFDSVWESRYEADVFSDGLFQVDLFRASGSGPQTYEPRFIYHGFQYVELTGLSAPPTAETVTCCAVNNDFAPAGKFSCSNELFNKIQQATLWAYRGNFVNGVPTDCPHREKNGWTGDAHLATEQAQYNWENTACYEKWIRDLLDEQREDGNLAAIVPTSGWGYDWGNGPAWDSALVLVPWYLYQYKGDKRMLEEAYPGMKKYVDYVQSREKPNRLVDHGLGDWVFAKTETPVELTSSIYYFLDASIVAQAAGVLGKEEDRKHYSSLSREISEAFMKELVKPDGTIANGSQTAQSFPLMYEIIPSDNIVDMGNNRRSTNNASNTALNRRVAERLVIAVEKADYHLDVGILGAKSLFHVLSQNARTDLALKILNQKTAPSYGDWFERGATTLWEDWKDGSSRNHIMFGDISCWFYQRLAGIQLPEGSSTTTVDPKTVGLKSFVIEPDFTSGIDWVDAEHHSPYGMIKSSWKRDGDNILLDISVPVNTTATLFLYAPSAGSRNQTILGSGDYHFIQPTKYENKGH